MSTVQQGATMVMAAIGICSTLVQVGIFVGVMGGVRDELRRQRDALDREREERSRLAERIAALEGQS